MTHAPYLFLHQAGNTFSGLLLLFREWWILALSAALVVALLFAFVLLKQTPLFEASSVILIEISRDKVVQIDEVVDTSLQQGSRSQVEQLIKNHFAQLVSRTLRQNVIDTFTPEEKTALVEPYAPGDQRSTTLEKLIEEAIDIRREQNAHIFRLRFFHRDPRMAALLANRYAEHYILYHLNRSDTSNISAIDFLEKQVERLRGQVEESESALQRYREDHTLISVEEDQQIAAERVKTLDQELTTIDIALSTIQVRRARIEQAGTEPEVLLEIPFIAAFAGIPQLVEEMNVKAIERAALQQTYLERHPKMIENTKQIEALKNLLKQHIEQAVAHLENEFNELTNRRKDLLVERQRTEQEILEIGQKIIEANVLSRKIERDKIKYDQILIPAERNQGGQPVESDQYPYPGQGAGSRQTRKALSSAHYFCCPRSCLGEPDLPRRATGHGTSMTGLRRLRISSCISGNSAWALFHC